MAIKFLDPGSDATFDLSQWTVSTGIAASATDQVKTGTRSIKLTLGAAGEAADIITPNGTLADAGRRISVFVRWEAFGTATAGYFLGVGDNGETNDIFLLKTNSSGNIQLDSVGAGVTSTTTGSTVLSLNTWYQVDLCYTITNATNWRCDVHLTTAGGVTTTEISKSSAGSITINTGSSVLVLVAFQMGNSKSMWYDNIYIDDGATYAYPGNILVTAKRPNANGTTNGFTTQIGAGGSGYGSGHSPQVNERALSTTNGWSMIGAGAAVTEEYNIENAATGDVPIRPEWVVDYVGWVYAKALASETASIIVNGVSSNISLTSTNTFFAKVAGSTTYPVGTGADIGIITTTALTTVSLYECGIMVAYIPVTNANFFLST